MLYFILKNYLKFKIWFSKLLHYIGEVYDEIEFLKSLKIELRKGLITTISWFTLISKGFKYKPDKNVKFIDMQFDAIQTHKRGGDIGSVARVFQVLHHMNYSESYLISYIAKPFKKSHVFVLLIDRVGKNIIYTALDYGKIIYKGEGLNESVRAVAKYHNSEYLEFAIQDIFWKIVEKNNIK